MGNNREYHQLRTMEEVRREKMRIKYEIDRKRDMLEDDFERVEEVFSGEYLLDVLAERSSRIVSGIASRFSSYVRNFSSGFNLLSSLMGTIAQNIHLFRSGKPRRGCYEEDYYDGPEDEEYVDEEGYGEMYEEDESC